MEIAEAALVRLAESARRAKERADDERLRFSERLKVLEGGSGGGAGEEDEDHWQRLNSQLREERNNIRLAGDEEAEEHYNANGEMKEEEKFVALIHK